MDFEAYLLGKKIDAGMFLAADPIRFAEWERIFATMHPDSFTAQKKFLINETRRRFHINQEV